MTSANVQEKVIGQCIFAAFGEVLDKVVELDMLGLRISDETRHSFLKTIYEAFPIEGIDAAMRGEESEMSIGELGVLIGRMEGLKKDLDELATMAEQNKVEEIERDYQNVWVEEALDLPAIIEKCQRINAVNAAVTEVLTDAVASVISPLDGRVELVDPFAHYGESIDPRVNVIRHVRLLADDLYQQHRAEKPVADVDTYVAENYGSFIDKLKGYLFNNESIVWDNVKFLEEAGFKVYTKNEKQVVVNALYGELTIAI